VLQRARFFSKCLLISLFWAPLLQADALPRPVGLEAEVAFWRTVFAEVDSNRGIIHDNRHLSVIYGTVDLPADASPLQRRTVFNDAKKQYQDILQQLARGARHTPTSEQQAVLAKWPAEISDEQLLEAADRLRIQQGLADRFQQGLVRSGQWLNHIKENLKEAGVPEGLAALPHVESSFDPTAYSHVGAAGLWQFTRSTGKRFMQVDHVVDARRDPFLSSEAAAKLLQYNYQELGSWPLAITAYNHGVTGMKRAIEALGTDDIAEIVHNYNGRAFGFASRNFYVAFLAALEVEQNADNLFGPVAKALPRDELVVVMPHFVPVAVLEKTTGVARADFRELNPALQPSVWDGSKYVPQGYTLRLPKDTSSEQLLASIPRSYLFDAQRPDLYHKVRRGEYLSSIARRYGTTVNELVAWNNLKSRNSIQVGQLLRLPRRANEVAVQ
jgi:membrane-bound lytic murein transglycosylase D